MNSTALTVPRASTKTALSDHLEDEPPVACDPEGAAGCISAVLVNDVCSHILTVRSKDADASIVPNSGCAQHNFVIVASCA